FSMIASSNASTSLTSSTTTGTSCRPARWAACQRRSPAMISKASAAPRAGRTAIGWMMPRSLMEAASSTSWATGTSRRGLRGLGRRNSIGTRRWLRARSGGALVSAPISPIRDARPRPSRDRVGSSAIAASPEKAFTSLTSSCLRLLPASPGSIRREGGQFPLALNDLGGETQIGFAADAFEVVDQNRLAVGRRLRHAHIARDHGVVDFLAHEFAYVGHHLAGEIVARIEHGQHDAVDAQSRVEGLLDLFDGLEQ